jgi:hypothetical protein
MLAAALALALVAPGAWFVAKRRWRIPPARLAELLADAWLQGYTAGQRRAHDAMLELWAEREDAPMH